MKFSVVMCVIVCSLVCVADTRNHRTKSFANRFMNDSRTDLLFFTKENLNDTRFGESKKLKYGSLIGPKKLESKKFIISRNLEILKHTKFINYKCFENFKYMFDKAENLGAKDLNLTYFINTRKWKLKNLNCSHFVICKIMKYKNWNYIFLKHKNLRYKILKDKSLKEAIFKHKNLRYENLKLKCLKNKILKFESLKNANSINSERRRRRKDEGRRKDEEKNTKRRPRRDAVFHRQRRPTDDEILARYPGQNDLVGEYPIPKNTHTKFKKYPYKFYRYRKIPIQV